MSIIDLVISILHYHLRSHPDILISTSHWYLGIFSLPALAEPSTLFQQFLLTFASTSQPLISFPPLPHTLLHPQFYFHLAKSDQLKSAPTFHSLHSLASSKQQIFWQPTPFITFPLSLSPKASSSPFLPSFISLQFRWEGKNSGGSHHPLSRCQPEIFPKLWNESKTNIIHQRINWWEKKIIRHLHWKLSLIRDGFNMKSWAD